MGLLFSAVGAYRRLAEAGDSGEAPIPIAIETPRGLLVAALRATGRPVYAINPMAVTRYRHRHVQSGRKSDHADAMVLANILRVDASAHRPLPADSELAKVIAVLARGQQDAVWRRTRASNELRSVLREYHPGSCSGRGGAASRRPAARCRRAGRPAARSTAGTAPAPAVPC